MAIQICLNDVASEGKALSLFCRFRSDGLHIAGLNSPRSQLAAKSPDRRKSDDDARFSTHPAFCSSHLRCTKVQLSSNRSSNQSHVCHFGNVSFAPLSGAGSACYVYDLTPSTSKDD